MDTPHTCIGRLMAIRARARRIHVQDSGSRVFRQTDPVQLTGICREFAMLLLSLANDLLLNIVSFLPPDAIALLSCACKPLAHALQGNQELWREICRCKWEQCHASPCARHLYASGNGWDKPYFIAAEVPADFISALLPLHTPGKLLLATSPGLQVRQALLMPTCDDVPGGSGVHATARSSTLLAECPLEEAIVHSLDLIGGHGAAATVVGGVSTGALMLWRLAEDGGMTSIQHVCRTCTVCDQL